jgi:hypothetical protein
VIVFEIFGRKGDCSFYVAVKIGGDSKKMMGLVAISFDKAISICMWAAKAQWGK